VVRRLIGPRFLAAAPQEQVNELRCLIVDDHLMVAQALANLIHRQFGFTIVGLAASQAQARQLLSSHQPDLVILDLELADGSAMPLLESLQQDPAAADCRVIVVSGHASTFVCPAALRPLIAGVVDKGQAFEAVVEVIAAQRPVR